MENSFVSAKKTNSSLPVDHVIQIPQCLAFAFFSKWIIISIIIQ